MTDFRIAKSSEQARHEIATATVGLFIALAFALMAETVKDWLKEWASKHPESTPGVGILSIWTYWTHGEPCVTLRLALVFAFIGLSFFLGTQAWLWSATVQAARSKDGCLSSLLRWEPCC